MLALAAGADAICVGGGLADEETVLTLRDAIVAAVRAGELAAERLADAAARVRAPGRRDARAGRHRPAPEESRRPDIGLEAARRAVRVTGPADFMPLDRAAVRRGLHPGRHPRGRRRDALGRRRRDRAAAAGHHHRHLPRGGRGRADRLLAQVLAGPGP